MLTNITPTPVHIALLPLEPVDRCRYMRVRIGPVAARRLDVHTGYKRLLFVSVAADPLQ